MEGISINALSEIQLNLPKQNFQLNSCLKLISKLNKIIETLKIVIKKLIEIYIA